jgi:hypothetical protein
VTGQQAQSNQTPAEYQSMFRWERRASTQRFQLHLQQGLRFHPDLPEIARDRATYLGYRGAYLAWYKLTVVCAIPLFVVAALARRGIDVIIPIVIAVIVVLIPYSMLVRRMIQARIRHPNHRHSKLDPEKSDWIVVVAPRSAR